MIRVAGIRFQQEGKMEYYNAGELEIRVNDYVIAETARGIELGEVILGVREMEDEQVPAELPRIVRAATGQDIQQATENRTREREAYQTCQRKIAEHKLEMKLVSVETTFDNSKMLFYFTANGRVDFRSLVKDLASTFRTRIELRQIGVRDEARMLGGLGPCGRQICCGAFLTDFQPVSIKMAKEQSLSLNPTKISGVCGRLMCCLKYEQDQYEAVRKRMPRIGREVVTPEGNGTVVDLNVVKETVTVRIPAGDSSENRTFPLDQITRPGQEVREPAPATEGEAGREQEPETEPEMDAQEIPEELKHLQDPEPTEEKGGENSRPPRPRRSRTEKNGQRFGPGAGKPKEKREQEPAADKPKPAKPKGPKAKPADRDQKLGQPVRRENPEREKKNPGKAEPRRSEMKRGENGKRPEKKTEGAGRPEPEVKAGGGRAPEEEKKVPKSKGWAAALEKAMQAADQ